MNEVLQVPYQRLWFDHAVSDGIYTPAELRRGGLVVRQGRECTYSLRWPGGRTEPPGYELRVAGKPGHWTIVRELVGEKDGPR